MYKMYKPRTILNSQKHCDGGWFWNKYSAFPYIGCEYGCEYCYSRDEKYNPHSPSRDPEALKCDDPFSEHIKIKNNAPTLLKKALKSKPRDLIYLDSYQPIEAKYQYTRKMLEVCFKLGFPVFINEKSPLLLRDLDILKKISERSYLNVGWSIITAQDDETRRMFEPKAPAVSHRFDAMRQLDENQIITGTVFMPILPFIYDDEENIEAVVAKTRDSGGRYVLDGGLTLWGYCKTHFYRTLEKYDASLLSRYRELYESPPSVSEHTRRVHQLVLKYCKKYELQPYISRPIKIYPKTLQTNKDIAERFYLEARELQLSGQGGYKEWAYRKAAWSLDDLEDGVEKIFLDQGTKGLHKIRGIGKKFSHEIEQFLID